MRKFKLEIDELQVQSYDTTAAGTEAHGTIRGAEITGVEKTACSIECSYCLTCQYCGNSDAGTCPGQYGCGYETDFTCQGDCATDAQTCHDPTCPYC